MELDDQREACVAAVVFADAPFAPTTTKSGCVTGAVQPGVRVEVRWGAEIASGSATARQSRISPIGNVRSTIMAVVDAQSLLAPPCCADAGWQTIVCPLGQVLDAVCAPVCRGQAARVSRCSCACPPRSRRV